MKKMTFGSLFAGIGGFDLGLERAGMECKWQVEIDDFCNRVLEKHWPHVKRYRDVREVGKHNLEPVDLICGGFPCQDLSIAGKREGIDGARSGLWSEYTRILGEIRPRYVLVENVAGLLTDGIDRVLGDLSSMGYDAEWGCLPACDYAGGLHRRDRVYIVAYPESVGQIYPVDGQNKGNPSGGFLSSLPITRSTPFDAGRFIEEVRAAEFVRTSNGVPNRLDRVATLGNAVVPQIVEMIGRAILTPEAP